MRVNQKTIVISSAALGLAFGFGPVFLGTMGIFLKPMAASFSWSRGDVAMLPMFALLGTAVGAPIIGIIADKIGWRKVLGISVIAFPAGLLAMALAPSSYTYIVVAGFLVGIFGAGTSPAGYIAIISLAFDRRLGMSLGLAMIGIGVGSLAMPILATDLIEIMDWRRAYMGIALICLLIGVIACGGIFSKNYSGSIQITDREADHSYLHAPQEKQGLLFRQVIFDFRFWIIVLVGMIVAGATLGAFIHLVSYATDLGINVEFAAHSAGLLGLGVAVTRVGVGFLLDRMFAPFVACAAFLLGAAGLYALVILTLQSATYLPLAALLIGIATGAEGDLIPFLAKRYFGVTAFGIIFGLLMGAVGFGGAIGAYIYGLAFDVHKSYDLAMQISAILMLMCGFFILSLGKYRFSAAR